MPITFIITDAGKAAVKSGLEKGNNPKINAVGFGSNGYTATASQNSLQKEIKRLTTVSGQAASASMLHVTVQDESTDTYTVKEIGIYLGDGTLFAVYSQTDEIIEKAAAALVMLAIDIAVDDIDATKLTFGNAAFVDPPATISTRGVVMLNDSVGSTAKDQAATANAVKQANDNANTRETPAGAQAKVNAHASAPTAHSAGQISVNPPGPFSGLNSVQAMMGELGSAARLNAGNGANDVVQGSRALNAGSGLTGGGNLTGDRTISLGTPGQITAKSTNQANSTGHTHAIDKATTSTAGIVTLYDGVNSTDESKAATANAVKQANDNANSRETPAGAQAKVNAHANAATAHNAGQISVNPSKAFSGKNTVQSIVASLGSAAGVDAGTSSGQLMPVGAFGIGGSAFILSSSDAIQNITQSGLYFSLGNAPTDWPSAASTYGSLIIHYESSGNASFVVVDALNNLYVSSTRAGVMHAWQQVIMADDLAAVATSGSWDDILNKPAVLNALKLLGNTGAELVSPYSQDSLAIESGNYVRARNDQNTVTLEFQSGKMTVGEVPFARVSGAGSAAALNVGSNPGEVMEVGAFGLGGEATTISNNDDLLNHVTTGGFFTWHDPKGTGPKNSPPGINNASVQAIIMPNTGTHDASIIAIDYTGQMFYAAVSSGKIASWKKIYTNGDIVSIENGGTGASNAATARSNLGLSPLAASGAWGDVTGKPAYANRWPGWNEVSGKPNFAAVAFSGKWGDISGAPVQTTRWPQWGEVDNKPDFAAIATSGKWTDIVGIPSTIGRLSYSGDNSIRITAPSGDILQIEGNNQIKMLDSSGNVTLDFQFGTMTVGTVPAAHVSGLAGVATSGQLSADSVTGLNAWLGGMNAGDVGSYALLRRNDGNYHYAGDIVAGSALNYASAGEFESGGTAPGNWRAMGQTNNHGGADGDEVTLFLRVN